MEIKKLENSSVELTLTLQAEKIEEEYSKSIKDYAKKITMKGFRPGKAPASLVEGKFGAAIREEITFKLMEENLKDSYKDLDEKDRPLQYSVPVLQNEEELLPFKPNTDVTYSVIYDVMPSVKIAQYKDLEFDYEETVVTEKEVNAELDNLRQQNAMVTTKDGAIAEGDIVTLDYVELNEDGTKHENTERKDFTFTVGQGYNFYQLDKDIIGMKKDENKIIEKTYDDDSHMGSDYLGRTVKIDVTITAVKVKDVPELDDEFAQDVKEEYNTVADLVAATEQKLKDEAQEANKDKKLTSALDYLIKNTEIAIPQSMIDAQLTNDWESFISRFGLPEADVEKYLAANGSTKEDYFERQKPYVEYEIKAELILKQIQDEMKLEVSDEDIKKEMENFYQGVTEDNPNYEYFKLYAKEIAMQNKAKMFLIENNTFKAVEKKEEEKKED